MELHLETFPLMPVIEDVAKTIEPMATKNSNRLVIPTSRAVWSADAVTTYLPSGENDPTPWLG